MSNTTAREPARIRIATLLDKGSFVEIGGTITARTTNFNITTKNTPADGVITGYGMIDGNLVYVYSQDATVLKGAVGEMHAKKIAQIYEMAMKMGAPIIGLIDSAGLRLQEATDSLQGLGNIYMKQTLASGVIPQITAIFGSCGGGLALLTALSDFTFIEETKGKIFVNSPNALLGNDSSKCDTSSAKFQKEEVGIVDGIGTESEILTQIRTLISIIPINNEDDTSYDECQDDLNRTCQDLFNVIKDTSIALASISDNNQFFELKKEYAKEMVIGFIRLNGMTVGAVANRSAIYNESGEISMEFDTGLTTRGCEKAAEFVQYCDAFNIPILSLTNVEGYKADIFSEQTIAKAAGKLIYAFANATIPKVNVIVGKALGSSYLTMNSKAIGADMVFAWETAQIGMMDAKNAAKIMYENESLEVINQKSKEYSELQMSSESAAQRGYVDTIIDPSDTRKHVIGAFEMLFTKREDRPTKKHGTI